MWLVLSPIFSDFNLSSIILWDPNSKINKNKNFFLLTRLKRTVLEMFQMERLNELKEYIYIYNREYFLFFITCNFALRIHIYNSILRDIKRAKTRFLDKVIPIRNYNVTNRKGNTTLYFQFISPMLKTGWTLCVLLKRANIVTFNLHCA